MDKSSSWHSINADTKLGLIQKIGWIAGNVISNRRPLENLDARLLLQDFLPKTVEGGWDRIARNASPSRRLGDMFWYQRPWDQLASELGAPVRALEVRCGTGRYGAVLQECLGDDLLDMWAWISNDMLNGHAGR
nr:hypothetical protein [Gemmatimonadaceae bacterium]